MPSKIDFSSVFDSTLPNVYVKKISLKPIGDVDEQGGSGYDQRQRYRRTKNRFGKAENPHERVRFRDVSGDSRSLSVSVELVIKDRFMKNKKPYWFTDKDLLEFLQLRVVLSADKEVTKTFLKRQFTPKHMKRFKQAGQIQEQVVSIRKESVLKLEDFKKEKIEGKRVYSVNYNFKFRVKNYNPDHLAIFAHTFMNLNQVALAKQTFVESRKGFLQGNTVAEVILNNGETKSGSYIYLLPNKKIWAGPIFYTKDQGYMPGAFHTPGRSFSLQRKTISNLIVEDFRLLDEINNAKILLRPKEPPDRGRKKLQNKHAEKTKIIQKETYITEPVYSVDIKNVVRFLFHIDFNKIVRDFSAYGAFISKADKKAQYKIYTKSKIRNLRIFRERVIRGISKKDVKLVIYDDKRTELIARSTERNPGFLPPSAIRRSLQPNDADSEKVVVGAIREIQLSTNAGRGVRSFGITDHSMAKKTDGFYSYRVEIEFEDATIKFIKDELNKLSISRRRLNEYYNRVSQRGRINQVNNEFTSDLTEQLDAEYDLPDEQDILTNNKLNRSQFIKGSIANAPWLNAIAVYADTLFNFTNIKYDKILKVSSLLQQLVEPATGNTRGIELLLELMGAFENQIKSKIGTQDRRMDEMDSKTRTTAYKGKLVKNSFIVEKKFRTVHDSNVPNFVGYDFLAAGSGRSVGPKTITVKEYETRMHAENEKFFSGPATASPEGLPEGEQGASEFTVGYKMQEQYYSCLTPATIHFGQGYRMRTLNKGASSWSPRQYSELMSNILASNPRSSSPSKDLNNEEDPFAPKYSIMPPISFGSDYKKDKDLDISREAYGSNVANSLVMGNLGLTISSGKDFEQIELNRRSREGEETRQFSSLDPEEILGEGAKFITDKITKEETATLEDIESRGIEEEEDLSEISNVVVFPLLSSDDEVYTVGKLRNGIESISPRNPENLFDNMFSGMNNGEERKRKYLSGLPNQIKSLTLGQRGGASKDWFAVKNQTGIDVTQSPQYAGLFYYSYQHINRIEILTGFQKNDKGFLQISEPRFKPFRKADFDKISKENKTVLCRMVPYRDEILGFGKSAKLKMPEFDQFFIIGPRRIHAREQLLGDTGTEEAIAITNTSTEEISQQVFVNRVTEYGDLNGTGTKVLRNMIKRKAQQDKIGPEFASTTLIQQPYTVTRVGTKFSSEIPSKAVPKEASDLSRAFIDRATPGTATTTDTTTAITGPGTGGGTRGGY